MNLRTRIALLGLAASSASIGLAMALASFAPVGNEPCITSTVYSTPPDSFAVVCVTPCGVYECRKYNESVPTYGIGQSCGCPGGGPTVCCHIVGGWDISYDPPESFSHKSGTCGGACPSGTCTELTEGSGTPEDPLVEIAECI
jgi:hypothetical protein